jgi:hypothetical protein
MRSCGPGELAEPLYAERTSDRVAARPFARIDREELNTQFTQVVGQ